MLRIMSVQDMQRGILMWKGAFPCRIRRIWVIDAPYGSGTFAKAILGLLAPRVQDRIRFARRSSDKGLSPLVEDLGCLFQLPQSLGGDGEMDWNTVAAQWISQDVVEEQQQTQACVGSVGEVKEEATESPKTLDEEQKQTQACVSGVGKLNEEALEAPQTQDEGQKQTEVCASTVEAQEDAMEASKSPEGEGTKSEVCASSVGEAIDGPDEQKKTEACVSSGGKAKEAMESGK